MIKMGRKGAIWELILLFERFKTENQLALWRKIKDKGLCSQATFYRYYQRWLEADNKVNVLMREMLR